jgi:RNA-binding protein 5/10
MLYLSILQVTVALGLPAGLLPRDSTPSPPPADSTGTATTTPGPLPPSGGASASAPSTSAVAPSTPVTATPTSAPVAPASQLSSDGHVDYGRLACLLCQRGFKSLEQLHAHVRESALHQTNLDKQAEIERLRQMTEAEQKRVAATLRKERSLVAAVAASTDRRRDHSPPAAAAPVAQASFNKPIDDSNIGNKMLRSMGWEDGKGLGRSASGIVAPIAPEMHTRHAGIGAGKPTRPGG